MILDPRMLHLNNPMGVLVDCAAPPGSLTIFESTLYFLECSGALLEMIQIELFRKRSEVVRWVRSPLLNKVMAVDSSPSNIFKTSKRLRPCGESDQ
mmetsp:Transcript_17884/g.37149  ORF Transcript_17884/g.37149 Transcript_17884/m.37149 type:complete len:96 (+) Transcript_17884:430-717(+)